MFRISFIYLFLSAVILSITLPAWDVQNDSEVYYYYKGQPFRLKPFRSKLFIRFDKNLTAEQMRNAIKDVNELVSPKTFYDNKLFIDINGNRSDAEISSLIKNIIQKKEIEYASAVYSPDNGQTLIGAEDQLMVQFRDNITSAETERIISEHQLIKIKKLELSGGTSYLLKVSENTSSIDAANKLYLSGKVNWAEPDLYFTNLLCFTPNDTYFPSQWSLVNTGTNVPGSPGVNDCDMDTDSAWNITTGISKVIIAVSDTGCDTLHADIAANLIPGSGYDFYSNDPWAWDDNGHGTACTGIAAAVFNNNTGIAGVAPGCRIIPVKWMNTIGAGSYSGAVSSIIWSYQKGAWVINSSWGFTGGASSALDQAINDAAALGRNGKGTLFVCAPGNDNTSVMRYPANTHPKVLTAGSISPCNQRKHPASCDQETHWGSNYGSNLHVVSPGVKVYSTDMTAGGIGPGPYLNNFGGTSASAANVSGVCALVFSADTNLTWDSVRIRISRTSEKRGSYIYTQQGPLNIGAWNNEMGYGLVNSYRAVKLTYNILAPLIVHTPLPNTEDVTGPYIVNCTITPGGYPVIPSETKLFWSRNNAAITDSVIMTNISGNNWTANIPGNGAASTYRYYIKAKDVLNRVRTLPDGAPVNLFSFIAEPDNTSPVISHNQLINFPSINWPAVINVVVTDNIGIDSVWTEWYKNTANPLKNFKLINTNGNNYSASFNSQQNEVQTGDSVFYRIFARDNSSNHNTSVIPSSGYFKFKITALSLCESFNAAVFPPQGWLLQFTGTSLWTRHTSSAFGLGLGSAKFDFYNAPVGTSQSLITMTIDPTLPNDSIRFSHAYATYSDEVDILYVDISSNGGSDWSVLAQLNGGSMPGQGMVTAPPVTEPFVPAANQWSNKKYILPTGTNRIRFRCLSAYGNNLYLDSICQVSFGLNSVSKNENVPTEYQLYQNYPNPFNPITTIRFNIPHLTDKQQVKLIIFDASGRETDLLINDNLKAGEYKTEWNSKNRASGVYFYSLIINGRFIDSRKMILLK